MNAGVDIYASVRTHRAVRAAFPQKHVMRLLCGEMNKRRPGISAAKMAETLALMGFNFFTAQTTAQEWRRVHNMKGTA